MGNESVHVMRIRIINYDTSIYEAKSWREANWFIRKSASRMTERNAAIFFEITFSDGQMHSGFYRLNMRAAIDANLYRWVKDFVMFLAGMDRPDHISEELQMEMTRLDKDAWVAFHDMTLTPSWENEQGPLWEKEDIDIAIVAFVLGRSTVPRFFPTIHPLYARQANGWCALTEAGLEVYRNHKNEIDDLILEVHESAYYEWRKIYLRNSTFDR